MWLTFIFAVIACIAYLYVPGFLLGKAIGLDSLVALVAAPLASITLYSLYGIALSKMGIYCTWAVMFVPVFIVCALAFAARVIVARKTANSNSKKRLPLNGGWLALGLYAAVGISLGTYFFAFSLETPASIVQEFDNGFHVSVMRAIYESGTWSILDVCKYLTPEDMAIVPLEGGGFYPAVWHITGAFLVSLLGIVVPVAENAVNFTLISIVFPASMMLFVASVSRRKLTLYLGAAFVLAFIAFPWVLLIWGPLYPNIFAYALVPVVAALFIRVVSAIIARNAFGSELAAFFLGACAIVFTQPNTIFFCVALLTPYCVYRLWTLDADPRIGGHAISRKLLVVVFLAFVLIVWTVFMYAPFMGNLLSFNWPASLTALQAIDCIVNLGFYWYAPQIPLAILVLLGIAYTLVHREYLWITVAYLFFCVAYFLCVSTESFVKHFIAGFWYTDSFRIMACMAVIGVPLASFGFTGVVDVLKRALDKHQALFKASAALLLALFCVFTYAKSFSIAGLSYHTPLDQYRGALADHVRTGAWVAYSAEEREFVDKVKELVGEDELVVNIPEDGSAYAYGVNGLRTYYRDYRTYTTRKYKTPADATWESFESQRIRLGASDIAQDDEVRAAFDAIGAQYVLILDQGEAFENQPVTPYYNGRFWTGLSTITDDTPGFEIVLSEGDMRLYRIVPQPDILSSLMSNRES